MEVAEQPQTKRETCTATARNGERCTAWPVRGQTQCSGHLGLGKLDPKLANQRSAEARRRRLEELKIRREMGFSDHAAAVLAENAQEIAAAFVKAGLKDGDWRALDALATRVLGKPKETISVDTSREIDLGGMNDLELQELKRRLETEQRKNAIPQAQTG